MLTEAFLAGVLNWIVTTIIVRSKFTEPIRLFLARRNIRAKYKSWFWANTHYLSGCHLCMGVWVGFMVAAVWRSPLVGVQNSVVEWFLWALITKGIGHLIFEITEPLYEWRQRT